MMIKAPMTKNGDIRILEVAKLSTIVLALLVAFSSWLDQSIALSHSHAFPLLLLKTLLFVQILLLSIDLTKTIVIMINLSLITLITLKKIKVYINTITQTFFPKTFISYTRKLHLKHCVLRC